MSDGYWIIPLLIVGFLSFVYPALWLSYKRRLTDKRKDICSLMTRGNTLRLYLKAFGSSGESKKPSPKQGPDSVRKQSDSKPVQDLVGKDAANDGAGTANAVILDKTVTKLFDHYYSWKAYVLPITINVVLTLSAGLLCLVKAGIDFPFLPHDLVLLVRSIPAVCIAGFGGAYIWGMYDLLRRFQQINLSPVSLHYIWLKLLLAPPLAYLLTLPLAGSLRNPIAFALMAIPVARIYDFMINQAKNGANLQWTSEPTEGPTLGNLQGVTDTTVQILIDEGITSATQLALVDPFKLLLKTNLEWRVILDLIDQALLFNYIGNKVASIRSMGCRCSIELATLQQLLTSSDLERKAEGEQRTAELATKLELDLHSTKNLIENCYEDLQIQFIWDLWGDAIPSEEPEEARPKEAANPVGSIQPAPVPAPSGAAGPP